MTCSPNESIGLGHPRQANEVRAQEGPTSPSGRLASTIPAVILMALLLVYAACIFSTAIGLYHDDGIYVATAKSLAEGHGYRIDSDPETLAQTKYPPLLPLVLSVIWRIVPKFPENAPLLKLVSLASLLAWAGTCYCFFTRCIRVSRPAALWLLIAVLLNEWSLFCASAILTEHLYSALALGSLMILIRMESKFVIWAGILAGLAYLTRTTGCAVIAAGLVALVFQKRWKHAALFGTFALPFVAGWLLWQHANAVVPGNPIEAYYTAQNYSDWNLVFGSSLEKARAPFIGGLNVLLILTFPARSILSLPFNANTSFAIELLTSLPVWIFAIRGVRRLGKQTLPWVLYAAASFCILTVWAWPPDRFLLPVLPFFVGLAFAGLPRHLPTVPWTGALAFPLFKMTLACSTILSLGVPAFAVPPWLTAKEKRAPASDWKKVNAVCEWIRRNSPPDAVILANYDPMLYLYTGHKSVRPFPVEPGYLYYGITYDVAGSVAGFMNQTARYHPQYFVETGREEFEEASYHQIIQELTRRGTLEIAAEIAPGYRIYSVKAVPACMRDATGQ
jgi:hypothetical protein